MFENKSGSGIFQSNDYFNFNIIFRWLDITWMAKELTRFQQQPNK